MSSGSGNPFAGLTCEESYAGRTRETRFSKGETETEVVGRELNYVIRGTTDDELAQLFLEATAPTEYQGLTRTRCRVKEKTNGVYEGTATFERESGETPAIGELEETFEITGEPMHINKAIKTEKLGYSPDVKDLIEWDGEKAKGIDSTDAVYRWTEQRSYLASWLTDEWKAAVSQMFGKINDDDWRGWYYHEVRFMGVTGRRTGKEKWTLTFNFASKVSEEIPAGTVPGMADPYVKAGWDYFWIWWQKTVGQVQGEEVVLPVAKGGYVQQVFDEIDMDDVFPVDPEGS